MNVGMLKKLLVGVPDDMEVVRSAPDHAYVRTHGAGPTNAEKSGDEYFEYFDDGNMNEDGVKVRVFLID